MVTRLKRRSQSYRRMGWDYSKLSLRAGRAKPWESITV